MEQNTKHIFGAYLNMARQNAFITLSHISKILGATKEGNEAHLSQMKAITILKSGRPEEKEKAVKILTKHFPFLKPMVDNDISRKDSVSQTANADMYSDILIKTFNILNLLRDQHSHYIFIDERIDAKEGAKKAGIESDNKKLVYYLKNCFDGARRIAKDRFEFSDDDMKFLTGSKSGDRYEEIIKTDENGEFIYNGKWPAKIHRERDDFAYKLDTKGKTLSPKGILFLICLFIEKKYATMLLDTPELHFFSNNTPEIQKKIIREIFSVYRIRLPKARIDSEKPVFALGLDMLNELKKCPDELFETLSKKDQDKFRIQPERDNADNDNMEILMKRYQDRFPYYAMRYFDDNRLLKKIRFQVSLGKYRYKFYEKKGIDSDNNDRIRALQKELNGFGRLDEIEKVRKEKWAEHIRPYEEIRQDTADEKPYITDHRANYVTNGNRIGMAFNSAKRQIIDKGYFIPVINGKETLCKVPDCWMSIHELKAMVFHNLLCDKDSKGETESVIINYVERYRRLFSDIKEKKLLPISQNRDEAASVIKGDYNLEFSEIPEKLQDYLTNKSVNIQERFNKLSKERIDKMISWSERATERLEKDLKVIKDSKTNKIGSDKYVDIKPGRLARFLSEDILLLQPTKKQGRDKLTGMNFQVMQSSLAIYDKSIEELRRMFVSAQLIGSNISHPFLDKVLDKKPQDTIKFYQIYLEKRIKYLKKLTSKDYKECNFLFSGRQKWTERDDSYYTDLSGRYLEQPIELPRGLFNEVIKEKLKSKYSDKSDLIASLSKGRCNVSFLIAEFFRHIHDDDNQPFYAYKRTYDIFNNLKDNRTDREIFKPKKEHYLSLDDILLENETLDKSISKYMQKKAGNILSGGNSGKNDEYNKIIECFKEVDLSSEIKQERSFFNKIKKQVEEGKRVDGDIAQIKSLLHRKGIDYKNIKTSNKTFDLTIYEGYPEYKKICAQLRDFRKNEKVIRQYKVQDILLYLMAKDVLINSEWKNNEMDEIGQYKLKNIIPEGDNNILSLRIPFSISLKLEDNSVKTIRQESLKLKNYGDFFKFIYDQRIKTLLPQIKSAKILDREVLEKELEQYDLNRTPLFKLVLDFEKSIVLQKPELELERHDFKQILNEFNADMENKDRMRLIRNAFCHNSYPKLNDIEEATKSEIPKIASSLVHSFKKLANN
ncbi:type VI-B CRISPR-associated RNA-guided ribonuclease Cas13b [Dysgonomonas sp. 511]|uniref:type VI-B CRISPR-associated RNA-guided ribonuclease Cas13b n=1 Tax=Dysgonomonas sp. 511 TaxID=2302930 RepID=UPI0013D7D9E6|nr:type VI-B CRISPR-associated RNA-guided ribonuclease Cas13b [Dysgonomonas sp. 511]NDV80194.1 hypothetical protein [Dysgonomonas sp. 511]